MKKEKKILLMLLTLFLLIPLTAVKVQALDSDTKVIIPDKNLRQCILEELKKDLGYTITKEDMKSITSLDCNDKNITNITGLENCTNLKKLYMQKNNISDIKPLSSLKELNLVNLSFNNISDISSLSSYEKLDFLIINNNKISDLSPLANNKHIGVLYLSNNEISDLSPLSSLKTLVTLKLDGNHIYDISPLKNLRKLQTINNNYIGLTLENQTITLSPQYIGDNTTLNLANIIKDQDSAPFTYIKTSTNSSYNGTNNIITFNSLNNSNEVSYTFSKRVNNLATHPLYSGTVKVPIIHDTPIQISNNNLRKAILNALGKSHDSIITKKDLESITSLNASSCNLTDVTELKYCINLSTLNLSHNNITHITPLSSLKKLTNINLSFNKISNIEPLSNLKELVSFDLSNENILLPQAVIGSSYYSMKNPINYHDSQFTTSILDISNNGIYNSTDNTLTWNNIQDSIELKFKFSRTINIEKAYGIFSGSVTKSLLYNHLSDIKDTNLQEAILGTLKKGTEDIITKNDLDSIIELNASNKNIKSLEGLDYCHNLKILNISNNSIFDISILNKIGSLEKVNASNQLLNLKADKYKVKSITCKINNPIVSYTGLPLTKFTTISDNGTYFDKSNSIKWQKIHNDVVLYFDFDERTPLKNNGVCIFTGRVCKYITFTPNIPDNEDVE